MSEVAIYARLSQDRQGNALGVDRQLAECRELASRIGLTVIAEYVDNDASATSGKVRPQFEALVASKPDAIIAWHQDRLLRRGVDLERVIALNVPVYTVSAGTLDLSNPAGRAVARTVAAWSQYEGEQKAARQRAQYRQAASAGLPHRTHRVFGWEPDGITLRESEAQYVREMHSRVLRGESIRAIGRWLDSEGVVTAKAGKGWTHAIVRASLLRPRNAGILMRDGVRQPVSQIQPIVSEETHEAVVALLSARSAPGRPVERWWLASAMTCHCDAPMGSKQVKSKGTTVPNYVCRVALETAKGGHASIAAEIAHEKVREALRLALTDRGYEERDDSDVIRLRNVLSGIAAERVAAQELYLLPGADRSAVAATIARLGSEHEAATADLERVLADRASTDVAASIRGMLPHVEPLPRYGEGRSQREVTAERAERLEALEASIAAWNDAFDALDVERKRQLVRAHLAITVLPAKGNGYGAKRLKIEAL